MLSGYSYSLKDGAEDELNTIVTADFDEAPLDIALDRLLAQIKLFWEKKDGIYYIYKEKEALFDIFFPLMSQSFEITSSRVGNTIGGSGTVSSSAGSNSYSEGGMSSALSKAMASGKTSTVESLSDTIQPFLTETGKFAIHKETGTIWIRDRGGVVDRIGEFIAKLNKRLRIPVNVKGIITEVTLNQGHEYGIDWDKALSSTVLNGGFFKVLNGDKSLTSTASGFANMTSNTIAISASFAAGALNSYIRALEEYGDVKVISKPSLTVLNGAIGSLIVGQTLSYVAQSYSSKTASYAVTTSIIVKPLQTGLSFYVLPRIISDEEALVYISPEITALQERRTIQAGDNATVEAPSLSLKQTQTVINIKNGSTILISGLMSEENKETDKRVPILGDIPILGAPFRYKSNQKRVSEVAIMVEVSW
jgi:type IVB pilus formation R64 PilN family outer membrane protein